MDKEEKMKLIDLRMRAKAQIANVCASGQTYKSRLQKQN